MTTHGLRYTAARIIWELTNDWEAVKDITGHVTMEMAKKYAEKKRRTTATVEELGA